MLYLYIIKKRIKKKILNNNKKIIFYMAQWHSVVVHTNYNHIDILKSYEIKNIKLMRGELI